jgi:hypothetical protein
MLCEDRPGLQPSVRGVERVEKALGALPELAGAALTDDLFRAVVCTFWLCWPRRVKQADSDRVDDAICKAPVR